MKLVVLNSKSRYRLEDQEALEAAGAVFYQSHSTKLTDISKFYGKELVVLGVQPDLIEGFGTKVVYIIQQKLDRQSLSMT